MAAQYEPVFQSIEEFYAADERRRHSGELDFGVWWYASRHPGIPWRVSWVQDTGDLYAVCVGRPTMMESADAITIIGGDQDGPVVRLAVITTEHDVETRLAGWEHQCGQPDSLEWVRGRVQ